MEYLGNHSGDKEKSMIEEMSRQDLKIVVATVLDSPNYGSVLQAIATRELLNPYGDVVFADYRRPQTTWKGWMFHRIQAPGCFALNLAKLVMGFPARLHSEKVFRGFVERELALCSAGPFFSGEGLACDACYVVGSDQTWNAVYNRCISPLYFFTYVPDPCRKVALSASFGRDVLPAEESVQIKALLRRFDSISVRESSSVSTLREMGIESVALKDPVLLCEAELWSKLASEVPTEQKEYLLIYMLNRNDRILDYARRVALEKNLTIMLVTFNPLRPAPHGCHPVCLPTPQRWLALFRDASYVVTDSFHGICFSLIFERNFTAFDPPSFSVRLTDVLNDFDLSARKVGLDDAVDAIDIHDVPIKWAVVRKLRTLFQKDARAFLEKSLV